LLRRRDTPVDLAPAEFDAAAIAAVLWHASREPSAVPTSISEPSPWKTAARRAQVDREP
jgi:hypothetical protein